MDFFESLRLMFEPRQDQNKINQEALLNIHRRAAGAAERVWLWLLVIVTVALGDLGKAFE
jgi:hypothetical protein